LFCFVWAPLYLQEKKSENGEAVSESVLDFTQNSRIRRKQHLQEAEEKRKPPRVYIHTYKHTYMTCLTNIDQ
jgi:hypothetical protein